MGGEFIGLNYDDLQLVFTESVNVMKKAANVPNLANFNDEHITSIAVNNLYGKIKVNNANAYLYRFWTDDSFYLCSTCWKFNPVALFHIPSEKSDGFIVLFNYFIKKDQLPSREMIAKIMGFPKASRTNRVRRFVMKVKKKVGRL